MTKRYYPSIVALCTGFLTLVVFLPALSNGFVSWDDYGYVYQNRRIMSFTLDFVKWAFTDTATTYWQPIPWLSHALDYALWGLNPAGHHFTAILLHAISTTIVVLLALRLLQLAGYTGMSGASAGLMLSGSVDRTDYGSMLRQERTVLIAAGATGLLFGLHPHRVEAAVWITSRKDLLCALFYLLSMYCYLGSAAMRGPRADRHNILTVYGDRGYITAFIMFLLASASKPAAVSLPIVLMILDWYPLKRISSWKHASTALLEKTPFVVVSLIISVVTYVTQRSQGGVMRSLEEVPFLDRFMNAVHSIILYLVQMVVPLHLQPIYPIPRDISYASLPYAGAAAAVAGITIFCLVYVRKQSWWLAIWSYYLITLLPALGFVQIWNVAMADRWTYLPSIGPLLVLGLAVEGMWNSLERRAHRPAAAMYAALLVALCLVGGLSYLTVKQINLWRNSLDFWSYVIEREPENVPYAYGNRGIAWKEAGQLDRAIEDYTKHIKLDWAAFQAYNNRGIAFMEQGHFDRALSDYGTAIELAPDFVEAYTNRGMLFETQGRDDRAYDEYTAAIAVNPSYAPAYYARGLLYQKAGRYDLAIEDLSTALKHDPGHDQAYVSRGSVYELIGGIEQALSNYSAAIQANPSNASAYNNRGLIYDRIRQYDQALADLNRAIVLDPSFIEAFSNRGLVHEDMGRIDLAVEDYSTAITLNPDDHLSYNNRGSAYLKAGQYDKALHDQTKAISLNPNYAQAYLDRSECYRAMGDAVRARRDRQKACDLGAQAGCGQPR